MIRFENRELKMYYNILNNSLMNLRNIFDNTIYEYKFFPVCEFLLNFNIYSKMVRRYKGRLNKEKYLYLSISAAIMIATTINPIGI